MTTHAKTNLLPLLSHKAEAYGTGTELGAEIDTQGFSHVLILLNAGTATGSGTLDVAVTESAAAGGSKAAALDDASTPAAIAFPQVVAANDDQLYAGLLRTDRRQRYLQLSAVIATAAVDFSITVILLNPDHSERASDGYSLSFEV